jgi:hypothetical protein
MLGVIVLLVKLAHEQYSSKSIEREDKYIVFLTIVWPVTLIFITIYIILAIMFKGKL